MMRAVFFPKNWFLALFFSIIYKDSIFLFIYYEKLNLIIAYKGVEGVEMPMFIGTSLKKGVVMIISRLQIIFHTQLSEIQSTTNFKSFFKKVSLKVSQRCRKTRHLQNKVSINYILIFNYL